MKRKMALDQPVMARAIGPALALDREPAMPGAGRRS